MALAAPLHALPEIKFDKSKSLGTWQQFVTSLGLQKKPNAAIYFDTDRLVVGEQVAYSFDFEPEHRRQIRTGVGRVVKQAGGPDIVVYDFDEIYTAVGPSASIKLPTTIYIFGRRPAAIVADGQISNWPAEALLLTIYALNSCDPNDTTKRAEAGLGRGGDGRLTRYVRKTDGQEIFDVSEGGGGGYGTAGASGRDTDGRPHHFLSGGLGGAVSYSWDVLRPGSPGGRLYALSDSGSVTYEAGGVGGGAVWIKSGGRLDLNRIYAWGGNGYGGNTSLLPAGGSGGHVILESPEIPNLFMAQLSGGGYRGGAGVLEFRGTPGAPKLGGIIAGDSREEIRVPVGLPGVLKLDKAVYDETHEPAISSRPRIPVPAVTASTPRRATNAQKFVVAASATGVNIPASVRYRVRPPRATFFGRWITAPLPAGGKKNKSWQTNVVSRAEGIWQVEVVADDTKGGRSTGKVVSVTVDRRRPGIDFSEAAARPAAKRGDYTIGALVYDYDKDGIGKEASGPARVEYRLKRPGSNSWGNWTRVTLGNKTQYPDWPSLSLRVPFRLDPAIRGKWTLEVRVLDVAGNASDGKMLTVAN